MIYLYPGGRLGRNPRPVLAFTLGYQAIRSILTPEIVRSAEDLVTIRDLRVEQVPSGEDLYVIHAETVRSLRSEETPATVDGRSETTIVSEEVEVEVKPDE